MISTVFRHSVLLFTSVLALLFSATALAQSFTEISPTVRARSEASAVEYRGDIYVFNGFGPDIKIENTVEKFDVATRKWSVIGTTSALLGNAVTHNGLVRNGKDVWLIGGRIGNNPGKVSDQTWIYNLESKKWRRGPVLPYPVASGGAALVNNRIHWFGGVDPRAACDVDRHFVYDLGEPTAGWQNITSTARMPVPRNHFATVVANGLIYAIGGQHGHDGCRGPNTNDLPWVHSFNPATSEWKRLADLPVPQSHSEPSSFEYKGYLYTVGGRTNANKVQRYNPETNRWKTVLTMPERLLAPVSRVVDGKLLVASGGAPSTKTPIRTVRLFNLSFPTLNVESDVSDVVPHNGNVSNGGNSGGVTSPDDTSTGKIISVEAEYHDLKSDSSTHQWTTRPLPGASNNDAMMSTPDVGVLKKGSQDNPKLTYLVYFDEPGAYYLWIRGWGDTDLAGNGFSDSVHAGVNGILGSSADKIHKFPAGWNWSRQTRDNVPATIQIPSRGVHAVNLWMREDGFAVDKFLLTKNKSYVPVGVGPAANDGTSTDSSAEEPAQVSPDPDQSIGNSDSSGSDGSDGSGNSDSPAVPDSGSHAFISIEAERFSANTPAGSHRWGLSTKAGASGDSSVKSNIDIGALRSDQKNSPMLSYIVNFPKAGTYEVWIRGWGDTNNGEGKADSVHVGLNGKLSTAKAIHDFPPRWAWTQDKRGGGVATVVVPDAGTQTLNIWMREDGLIVDKIILTTDKNFVPSNTDTPLATDHSDTADEESHYETEASADSNEPESNDQQSGAGKDTIIVEVESFGSKSGAGQHTWIVSNQAGASGGKGMVTNINNGTLSSGSNNSPRMNYSVRFDQPGRYFVWVRGWGDTVGNEGKSDSVHVGLNGKLQTAKSIHRFPARWSWSNDTRSGRRASVTVPSAGVHTVNVWMREDGLILDSLMLTKDEGLDPDKVNASVYSADVDNSVADSENDSVAANSPGQSTGDISSDTSWSEINTSDGSKVAARHEAGGVAMNGKIYVLGGRGNRPVSEYDPAKNKWRNRKSPPIELNHFQPVVFDDKIWVVGAFTGRYPDETSVSHVYSYSPAADVWRKESIIPAQRRRGGAAAAVHNGRIIVIGGNTNGHRFGAKNWVDEYNPSTGQWLTLANSPSARDHATAAIADGKLVVAGGRASSQPNVFANTLARTDILDLDSGRWTQGASIKTQRAGAMTIGVGREVVVIGGESLSSVSAHRTVEAYNVRTDKWRTLRSLKYGRHSGAAVVLGDAIHVITGSERRGGSPESVRHEALRF